MSSEKRDCLAAGEKNKKKACVGPGPDRFLRLTRLLK